MRWKLTIFLMHFFDLVHVLAFTADLVIIEHVAISKACQLWSRKLCILTKVETMNGNPNYI